MALNKNAWNLGDRVRMRRMEIGMTQAELGERCNLSVPFIGHMERGARTPSVENLVTICKALTVTPNYLLQDYIEDILIPDGPDKRRETREKRKNAPGKAGKGPSGKADEKAAADETTGPAAIPQDADWAMACARLPWSAEVFKENAGPTMSDLDALRRLLHALRDPRIEKQLDD